MPLIQSSDNRHYKHVRALLTQSRQRKKSAETVIEGIHLLHSYVHKGYQPKQLWLSTSASTHPEVQPLLHACSNVATYQLEDKLYKDLRTLGDGVDILAVIALPTQTLTTASIDTSHDVLILNDVQDAGNLGTLLRTAAAVGIEHVLCTPHSASAWSPKSLRAGMGAQFSLNIYEHVAVTHIIEHMTSIVIPMLATSSHTESLIYQHDLRPPVAWVMGNEGQGVCDALIDAAQPVALPQPNGEESLNVAIAGALCMYEMLRQRQYS